MVKLGQVLGHKRTLGTVIYRTAQLSLACAVIGYYGQFVRKGDDAGIAADGKWVYAVATGSVAGLTYLVLIVASFFNTEYRAIALLWPWEFVLFVMWLVVFGIFAKMYIGENPEMDSGIKKMKRAVWVDGFACLTALLSFGYGAWVHVTHREGDFAKGRPYFPKPKRGRSDW